MVESGTPASTQSDGQPAAVDRADPRTWRGIFVIPQTPFDESGELALDDLRRLIDFCVESGAHGIVYPVMASEFFVLSDAERLQLTPIVVERVRRVNPRCPVVVGVAGNCTQSAVALARAAQEAGADAVIAMPPYVQKYRDADVFRYFEAIDKVVTVPIFIQNAGVAAQGVKNLLDLARQVEHVHFLKEEVAPALHNISAVVDAAEPEVWGVFGGMNAQDLFQELRRGAKGNMPGAPFTDLWVRWFDLWDAGQHDAAEALHRRLQPLINRAGPPKLSLHKRGIIRSPRTRSVMGAGPFDAHDQRQRDAFWPELEAEFTWKR
jgi:dihydrodipicolinate synthase/N-acetylneuraminate lyase